MRSKSIILLALALGCGLVASIGISQVMERRNQPITVKGEMQPVFVALHDLNPNDPITAANVKIEEWPKDKIQEGAITRIEDLDNMRARHKLFAGEQIVAAKIIDADDISSSSNIIPLGYRVVAVRVDAVSGSAGLIVPGDRVDVLVFLTKNPAQGVRETTTKTILQNIRVFAVDTTVIRNADASDSAGAAKTISLLVTPQQAEKVTLASELGAIRLVLRNDQEEGTIDSKGTEANDVFGGSGDRVAEQGNTQPQAESAESSEKYQNLLDLIKQQQQKKTSDTTAEATETPFRMMLIKGATVEEVQINGEGLAATVGQVGSPLAPPARPQPAAIDEPFDEPAEAPTGSSDEAEMPDPRSDHTSADDVFSPQATPSE